MQVPLESWAPSVNQIRLTAQLQSIAPAQPGESLWVRALQFLVQKAPAAGVNESVLATGTTKLAGRSQSGRRKVCAIRPTLGVLYWAAMPPDWQKLARSMRACI